MRDADAILHAGDFMDPAVLENAGARAAGARGGGQRRRARAALELPPHAERAVRAACGSGWSTTRAVDGRFERMRRRFPDTQAVVFGHSHMPLHEARDGFEIFNPGSPTERRRAPHHTMGIATVEGSRIDSS